MAKRFELVSNWVLATDRERAWAAISAAELWPDWWPGVVEATRLADGDQHGIGDVGRFVWKAPIGYRISFEVVTTARERPRRLEAAVNGDLAGSGSWLLDQDGPLTRVRYSWDVSPTRPWMIRLGRLIGPFLVHEHDLLMAAGARGLARHLSCTLISGG